MSDKDSEFTLPADFVANFKIPEGVVERATAKVEEAQREMLTEMVGGFVEAMGGKEGTLDFAKQLEEEIKQQLPPDLLEKYTALNAAMEALAVEGKNAFSDEGVVKLVTELNEDPRYLEITEKIMFGGDKTAEPQPNAPGEILKRVFGGSEPG